ncbi:MAG: lipase family protein [Chitinophagales bacterium]
MNKHFPLILAFCTLCISSSVHATGKLLSYQLVKSYTTAELAEFWRKNHVPKMIISAKDSVDVYEITYETQFMECNPQPVIASGLFFLPHHKRTNLPLLCYDHGTEIRREREITMNGEQTLCLGFATDGYAVAFPDYVGLGIGEKDQLYLNAESEARSSVDMLRAVRDLSIILSYNLNDKLFITGYSQGGHAAMATHKLIQEKFGDEFQVTASSPMSGPYDVYFTVDNGKDREYTYPGFLMMLVKSYYDTKKPGVNMKEALKAPYDSIIPPLLDGCSSLSQLDQYLPSIPYKALTDEFVNDYLHNPNSGFKQYLKENSVYNWKPEAPMQLCYCNSDEEVNYQNSLTAYETMTKNGSTNVKLRMSGKKFKHVNCALFAAVYTKMFFDAHLKGGNKNGPLMKRMLIDIGKLAVKP